MEEDPSNPKAISDKTLDPVTQKKQAAVSISIVELEKLVAENSYFLPSYEVRSSLKSISKLKETLENLTSELLPKKKFAFKNKAAKKDQTNVVEEAGIRASDSGLAEREIFQSRDTPRFRNQEGVVLVKHFGGSEEGDFSLSDLKSCEIRMTGNLRALFIHRLCNFRVFVGPVLGS
ncbi:hypothetical protein HHK36_004001 [Tetracentron sinense]|uniref:C-CAP/cofactor C-like domain-containing protein n=1 Tax=Tetracentron sinense TaxID=13715 RepID=A0A834ZTG9_TETSI|nr:hypothetical protein HHK36_004001 [Tetracentron sinense]